MSGLAQQQASKCICKSAACRPKGGSRAIGARRLCRLRTRKDKEKALALSAFGLMSGLAQQQASKCICKSAACRPKGGSRAIGARRLCRLRTRKDKEKALALSAFGLMSGLAQQQASKCICKSAACRPKGGSRAIGARRLCRLRTRKDKEKALALSALVGLSGLEPPTPTLSGWCSNLLSYNPIWVVEIHGFV